MMTQKTISLDDPAGGVTVEQRRALRRFLSRTTMPDGQKENIPHPAQTFYLCFGKRALDIILSLTALLVTLPVNAVLALCTLCDVGRPILFRQTRIGRDEALFTLVKFRNMRAAYGPDGWPLPASQRVTRFGRFVRRCSLDELLNFVSVLRGDMSIIGPRPTVPDYLPSLSARHRTRFYVRPGLACPAPIEPFPGDSWRSELEGDVWYVQHIGFRTDVRLLFRLIRLVSDRRGNDRRARADRGSFMGYAPDGGCISSRAVPEEYFIRALAEQNGDSDNDGTD